MTDLIQALTDAGASIATIIILAYLLIQQSKQTKSLQDTVVKNTEVVAHVRDAVDGLKDVIRGCKINQATYDELKKNR